MHATLIVHHDLEPNYNAWCIPNTELNEIDLAALARANGVCLPAAGAVYSPKKREAHGFKQAYEDAEYIQEQEQGRWRPYSCSFVWSTTARVSVGDKAFSFPLEHPGVYNDETDAARAVAANVVAGRWKIVRFFQFSQDV